MSKQIEAPGLAQWRRIDEYTTPKYGDFIIWMGTFKTWYCVVNDFDPTTNVLSVICEGTPRLLFSSTPDEMEKATHHIRLENIQQWKRGTYSVLQDENGKQVWYV
jgi:hypothetical protein